MGFYWVWQIKLRDNGEMYWFYQAELKDFPPFERELDDYDRYLINKYGRGCFAPKEYLATWLDMSDSQKTEFKELEKYYSAFAELYSEHYEDLKLYSLMYRNVPLYNISNDALSILYFALKKDEIIGFKQKLKKENTAKSQIVFLYYANEALFPQFCIKYLNIDLQLHKRECKPLALNSLKMLKTKIYPHVFSVNDLTDTQCNTILLSKGSIIESYQELVRKNSICCDYSQIDLEYDLLWLENPDKIREVESRMSGITSKSQIFEALKKYGTGAYSGMFMWHAPLLCRSIPESLKNGPYFRFEVRFLIEQWCNVIKEENERLRKIEEEKRRRELEIIRKREEEQQRKAEEARLYRIRYNIRNRYHRDLDISFDESTHQYMVKGEILQSVTNFVKGCFPEFDAEFFAKKKAAYLGKTTQEVLDMWEQKGKESRELGTELHKKIENYYQGIVSIDDDKTFNLFKMFADKIELKPYRTEWAVYDLKHNIAGTIDFVDYQNGEYIIYDWKRSEKVIENGMPMKINKYGEKGNYPLEHLDNTPYYHYALQLSLYKYILEKNYGMKISDLRLGIFHPSYNKPYVLRMPYLEKEINDIFNLRSEVIF